MSAMLAAFAQSGHKVATKAQRMIDGQRKRYQMNRSQINQAIQDMDMPIHANMTVAEIAAWSREMSKDLGRS